MTDTTFDTLSAADRLRAAGFDDSQARAIVEIRRAAEADRTTKAGMRTLRADMRTLQWVVGIQSAITLATFAFVAAKLL